MRWEGNPFTSEGRIMMLLVIGPLAGIFLGVPALFGVGVVADNTAVTVDTNRPLPESITAQYDR